MWFVKKISDGWGEQRWGPNIDEFVRRFDPASTNGEGTARLKNLYFIYLLELRALSKVGLSFLFVYLYQYILLLGTVLLQKT